MNRLHSPDSIGLDAPTLPLDWRSEGGSAAQVMPPPEHGLKCSLFAPMHYESGYAYPLLIWLHGDGGDARQLRRVMPHVSLRNYVAVAPQGLRFTDGRNGWPDSVEAADYAADQVRACIELMQHRYHVHSSRVFIAGYQSGGTMALRLGLSLPEWFAGAISLEGRLPRGGAPLRRIKDARKLPLLLATYRPCEEHGDFLVADDLRLLHAAGISLALRQYPCDDELTTTMLADVDRWMMERVCGNAAGSRQ